MPYGAITRERHYMLTARHNRPTSRAPSKDKPHTEATTLIRDEDKGGNDGAKVSQSAYVANGSLSLTL